MRILYLAHRIPDAPTKGDKIRAYHQIRALAARHDVTVLALDDEPRTHPVLPGWKDEVADWQVFPLGSFGARARVLGAMLGGGSLSAAHFAAPALRRALRERTARGAFDRTVVYSGAMDPLAGGVRPRLLDLVDVDSAKFEAYHREGIGRGLRRSVFGLEGRRLARLEARAVTDADLTLVCTRAEADLLERRCTPRRLEVVGNGVDLEAFPFGAGASRERAELLFVGALDYPANVDAARLLVREILPRLRQRRPEARVTLVGSRPVAELRALAGEEGVELHADVASVLPFLHRATLAVQPFAVARGIQNKALEALATGLPLLTTSGPAAALAGRPGEDYLVCDTAEETALRAAELLGDADRREVLARNGRRLIEERFSWDRVLRKYVELVEELGAGRAP